MLGKKNTKHRDIREGVFLLVMKSVLFLAGLFVLALGAACLIQANLGVATWDVLHIGLTHMTSLSIGTWVQIVGILMILFTCLLDRQLPQIGSLLNIILIGFFLNGILKSHILPTFDDLWARTLLLVIGTLLMGAGSGMYVASRFGAGPRDGLTLVLAKRWGWSIRLVRTLLEAIALLLGWMIGGPVAAGTFVSVILIGPVMQASLKFWTKQVEKLSMKNTIQEGSHL